MEGSVRVSNNNIVLFLVGCVFSPFIISWEIDQIQSLKACTFGKVRIPQEKENRECKKAKEISTLVYNICAPRLLIQTIRIIAHTSFTLFKSKHNL